MKNNKENKKEHNYNSDVQKHCNLKGDIDLIILCLLIFYCKLFTQSSIIYTFVCYYTCLTPDHIFIIILEK